MSKLKKGLRKAAKAAAIAGAAYGMSKAMGAKGAETFSRPNMKDIAGNVTKKKSMFRKILDMGPGPNATSKMGGTLADKVLRRKGAGLGPMDGAKMGKMIYAKYGKSVMAKGCKLGRKKATKLS